MRGRHFERYIGDGAYVYYDGYHVWLYTLDGTRETNRIALEPRVLDIFKRWLADLRADAAAKQDEDAKPDASDALSEAAREGL